MKAVILAGGVGSRLGKFTKDSPKCLLRIGDKTIVRRQLEALSDNGVGPILIVLGYKADMIREEVGERAEFVVNERYAETNSLYSLWLARDWVDGPFVLLNSDLVFDPEILHRLLEEDGNIIAYDSTASRGREQTKIAVRERRVLDLGKDLPAGAAHGESLGLLSFDAGGAKVLLDHADEQISAGFENSWVTEAVRSCCQMIPIYGVNVAGLPWAEVDFPQDLEEARKEVLPAIERNQSPGMRLWRRTRWAATALIAATLTLAGWIASSELGPASVEWDTVSLSGAQKVSLQLTGRTQKWWKLKKGEPATVSIDGERRVRVYSRALFAAVSGATGRCLLEIELDGQPADWAILDTTPDAAVSLQDFVVGVRDRFDLAVPTGSHELKVSAVAGECQQMLVRIRQEE